MTEDYAFLEEVFAQIMSTEAPKEHRDEFLRHEPMKAEQELFADVFTQIKAEELKAEPEPSKKPEQAKQDFTFTFSASEHPYNDKNSIFWPAVNYRRVTLSLNQFEKIIRRGFCFTSIFSKEKFTLKDKTEANWIGSQFIVFDLDNVRPEVTLNTFISSLYMKPTVAYTTPNNRIKKPSEIKEYSRFRLVYIFDSAITSKTQYQSIYNTIESNFPLVYFDITKKKDNCGSSPVQQFAGNALPTCEVIVNKESIYSSSTFPTEPSKPSKPEPSKPSKPSKNPTQSHRNKYRVDDDFLHDLYHLDTTTFLGKYFTFFGVPMMHTPLEYKNGYGLTDDNYRELKPRYVNRQIEKWKDHEGRRSKMFIFCKIRMIMKPDITLEELVYNLVFDRLNFFDNKDKVLTNETLIRIAYNAMHTDYEIKQSEMKKPKFKIDKRFCKEHGIKPNSYKNTVKQILNYDSIDAWYDPQKSVKENLHFAKDNDIKTSRPTLYRYCASRGIDPHGTKPTEPSAEPKPSEAIEQNEAVQSAPEPQKPSAKILAIDFSEYRKKCKLYQTIFGNRTTNKNLTLYNYERKQEEAASF